MHSRGIVHKPVNVLVGVDGHLVIADTFDIDLSRPLVAPTMLGYEYMGAFNGPYLIDEPVGTAEYTAPEIMVGSEYSFGVDFWSLGIIFYEPLFEDLPWVADNSHDLLMKIIEDHLVIPR